MSTLLAGGSARAGACSRAASSSSAAVRRADACRKRAVLLRDGFAYVFLVGAGQQGRAGEGGDRADVSATASRSSNRSRCGNARVVETGAGFLADGDTRARGR